MMYLITGAAGHLGTAIIKKLSKKDCTIRGLCLKGERNPPNDAEIVSGDVCDIGSLEGFFNIPRNEEVTVIHCAGIVSITSRFNRLVYDVNVVGTKNVTDMCVKTRVKKLIYVSSVHAITEKPKGEVMTEPDSLSADSVVGLYAKTKAEATAYVLDAEKRGLDAEVVFPSGIIGPYDSGHSHTNQLICDYVSGRLTSAVKGGYDFVDVRDVADGIISCIEKGVAGESYILSGGYRTIKEILLFLHEITGQREIKSFLPAQFVNLTAPLCELYYKLLRQPPLFTKYSIYTLSCNSLFSNEKAKKILGFIPRDIKTTLTDTVEWLRTTGRLSMA